MNIRNKIIIFVLFFALIPLIAQKNFLLVDNVRFNIQMWDTVNVYDWAVSFYINSLKPVEDFWYPYLFQIYFYPFAAPGNYFLFLKSFISILLSYIIWIHYFKNDFNKIIIFALITIIFFLIFNLKYQDRYYLTVLLFVSYFILFNNLININLGKSICFFLGSFLLLYEPNLFLLFLITFFIYISMYYLIRYLYKDHSFSFNEIKKILFPLFFSLFFSIFILCLFFNWELNNLIGFYSGLSDIFEYSSWKFSYKTLYKFDKSQSILIQLNIFILILLLIFLYDHLTRIKHDFSKINKTIFLFCLAILLSFFTLKSIMRDMSNSLLFLPLLIMLLIVIQQNFSTKFYKYIIWFLIIFLLLNIKLFINEYKNFYSQVDSFVRNENIESNPNFKLKSTLDLDLIKGGFLRKVNDIMSEDIYVVGDDVYLYELLGKKNSYYTNNFYNTSPFNIQDKLIFQLKTNKPKYIIIHRYNGSFYGVRHSLRAGKLFNFLSKNYSYFDKVEHFDILKLKEESLSKIDNYWFSLLTVQNEIYLKKIPYYYSPDNNEEYLTLSIKDLNVDKSKKKYKYVYHCADDSVIIGFDILKKFDSDKVYIPKKILWFNC